MTRQTILGLLFLLVGLALLAAALAPVLTHAAPSLAFVAVGIAVAIFGAFLLPSSGAPGAVQQIVTIAGPYLPKFGGQRAGDPPASPPAGGAT